MDKRRDKKAESKYGRRFNTRFNQRKEGFIRHEGGCVKELERETKRRVSGRSSLRRTRDGTLSGGLPWNRANSTSASMER